MTSNRGSGESRRQQARQEQAQQEQAQQEQAQQEQAQQQGRKRPQPGGTEPAGRLHDMGGATGPASIRGANVKPGGQRGQEAEPQGGYARPMGYVAGRDDDWAETAGSDEKAVAARTDEVTGNEDTFGPSPQRVPETGPPPGYGGDPAFRVRGPVEEEHHGEVEEDEPAPGAPDDGLPRPGADRPASGGHVSGDVDWMPSDEDDPDSGSGRTDADDGGYLAGEATGRPYRE